jgi:hypothetical protein
VKVLTADSDSLCSGHAYILPESLHSHNGSLLSRPASLCVSGRGVAYICYGGLGGAGSRESKNADSSIFFVTRYGKKFKFCFKNGLTKDFSNPVIQRKTITGPQKGIFLKSSSAVPVGFFYHGA